MIIESLLVVSVAAFHLPVVPWRPGSDRFMLDMKTSAQHIHRMDSACLLRVGEFAAVICLHDFWRIAKV